MKLFWNLDIVGLEKVHLTQGSIVCANHQSFFDPPFLGAILPVESYYLAKSELFKNKILGGILKYFNAIPIHRYGFAKTSIKRCEELLKEKKTLVIFPEGSRKSFSAKPGVAIIAWRTNATIFPVKILNIDKFKECFFRKKHLTFIFRKPFLSEKYKNIANKKPDYKKLAQKILDRINGLENDED
jgi:1-acyl-sn-glycerol-3-phosphate acyltransferase